MCFLGLQGHCVFDVTVCLCVCVYLHAWCTHFLTGLPSISSYFLSVASVRLKSCWSRLMCICAVTLINTRDRQGVVCCVQLYFRAIKLNQRPSRITHLESFPTFWHKNFALVCERLLHVDPAPIDKVQTSLLASSEHGWVYGTRTLHWSVNNCCMSTRLP